MTSTNEHAGLIDQCLDGGTTLAFLSALEAGDLIGLAIVACFDKPGYDRLSALRQLPNGRPAATALAVKVVVIVDPPSELLDHTFNQVGDHATELSLTEPQASDLLELLEVGTLDDERAAIVFDWIAPGHTERCRDFATIALSKAAPELTKLVGRHLALLESSDDPEHHKAVIAFAQRCADANQSSPALEAIAAICSVSDADVLAGAAVLGRILLSGQAITEPVRRYLERLSSGQVITTITSLEIDGTTSQSFDQQLLPHLFATHADELVTTITADWWPASSRTWMLDSAPWADHGDELLIRALKVATDDEDEDAVVRIRHRIIQRVEQASGENHPISAMPRLGSRTLLNEALQATMELDDPLLTRALEALDPDGRGDEYRRAKWSTPKRARRMASVVAGIDMHDVTDALIRQAYELRDSALAAWLGPVASQADNAVADNLVRLAAGRTKPLHALADTPPGAEALMRPWESDDDIDAFLAFENSGRDDQILLGHISDAVRNYAGPPTTSERRHLINRLEHAERTALLIGIIDDRKNPRPRRPNADLLVDGLKMLADELADTDPGDNLASLADLCRNQPKPDVRAAAYRVLARCSPTPYVVALLIERRANERTDAIVPVLDNALDAVAQTLTEIVASSDGADRAEALGLLDDVDPARALPHARRILDEETEDPAHRILAIQIVGNHGDESDLERLNKTAEDEPNPQAQEVLQHAIRQIAIGDLAGAHVRLGELAGLEPDTWNSLDPEQIWGDKKETLVTALSRVNKHQVNRDRESTVDQLGAELAKLVLYHTIETAGDKLDLSMSDEVAIKNNTMDYGDLVKRQQLMSRWGFVGSLHELYRLRREHLSPQGTWDPYKELTDEEYELALALFKRGVGPCLEHLARAHRS